MKYKWNNFWLVALTFSLASIASPALSDGYGTGHSVINAMRSTQNNMFISQSLEAEYGYYNRVPSGEIPADGLRTLWRGYGLRNTIGIEMLKFIQFSLSHTFINMRSKADSFENLTGSRMSGDTRFVFSSPIGNVEAGGGVIGSYTNYQREMERANYLGSGFYYSLGINYFVSSKISIFSNCKIFQENLVRSAGSTSVENIRTETTGIGMGFSVWI